jgi:hypothetical protein
MKYSKSTNGFYDITIHTEIPLDCVDITTEQWQSLLAGQAAGQVISADKNGNPVLKDRNLPSNDELISQYNALAQKNLDDVAKSWGYDSLVSAASYSNSTNPQFKAESDALVAWRDTYWAKAYTIEESSLPNTVEAFIAALPAAPSKPTA